MSDKWCPLTNRYRGWVKVDLNAHVKSGEPQNQDIKKKAGPQRKVVCCSAGHEKIGDLMHARWLHPCIHGIASASMTIECNPSSLFVENIFHLLDRLALYQMDQLRVITSEAIY